MRHRKYILDPSDLQYKLVRLHWKQKLLRTFLWFAASLVVSVFYLTLFENSFGSPKERKLSEDIEKMKLQYSLLDRRYENAFKTMDYLKLSDEERFRPILNMDSLPESFRKPGYGGVDRYRDLEGLSNSSLIISTHQKLDNLNNMANVQEESFKTINEKSI
jgi:hypothetical protein